MRASLALLCFAVGAAGCSTGHDLAIDLRTDFDPGREFVGVHTDLWRDVDPRMSERAPDSRTEITATSTLDFVSGRRVAEFGPVDPGQWWVRVTLITSDGATRGSRLVRVEVRGNRIVGVLISRSCEGVVCPAAGDAETDTECADGRCVDP